MLDMVEVDQGDLRPDLPKCLHGADPRLWRKSADLLPQLRAAGPKTRLSHADSRLELPRLLPQAGPGPTSSRRVPRRSGRSTASMHESLDRLSGPHAEADLRRTVAARRSYPRPDTHEVGPCQGRDVSGFSWWPIRPAAAGVKVERPTGRATLTPARTGAGSGDEKARDDQRRGSRTHPFGPPIWEDPHDVASGSGCSVRVAAVVQAHVRLRARPTRWPSRRVGCWWLGPR